MLAHSMQTALLAAFLPVLAFCPSSQGLLSLPESLNTNAMCVAYPAAGVQLQAEQGAVDIAADGTWEVFYFCRGHQLTTPHTPNLVAFKYDRLQVGSSSINSSCVACRSAAYDHQVLDTLHQHKQSWHRGYQDNQSV